MNKAQSLFSQVYKYHTLSYSKIVMWEVEVLGDEVVENEADWLFSLFEGQCKLHKGNSVKIIKTCILDNLYSNCMITSVFQLCKQHKILEDAYMHYSLDINYHL